MVIENGKVENKVCPSCGAEDVWIDTGKGNLVDADTLENLVDYEVKVCTCRKCGSPVYSKKVELFNRIALGEALRKFNPNRLSLKQIRGLPVKYGISRADFKKVMGIPKYHMFEGDEVEYQVFEGEAPDYDLEKRLRSIYDNPKYYVEFLKLAKGKISDEAYDKSMAKALELVDKVTD